MDFSPLVSPLTAGNIVTSINDRKTHAEYVSTKFYMNDAFTKLIKPKRFDEIPRKMSPWF